MAKEREVILVVEDDEDFRELLVEHLRGSGRSVEPVRDGAEALAAMTRANGEIGLVLLDLRMPVMDGFEVCRRVERSTKPPVPIVVMTAEHETCSVDAFRCVVAVLQKPLELDRLDALVDVHLG